MDVVLEMFGRYAHHRLEDLGKMILIKKSKAVGDRLDCLVFVLQHLACALHLH